MNVYSRVKPLADKRGLSIKELGEKFGISDAAIYRWQKHNPNSEIVAKLSEYFNVSSDYLLGLTDDPHLPGQDDMTPAQKEVAYFIDPRATEEDIEQIKKLVEIAKLSKRRL